MSKEIKPNLGKKSVFRIATFLHEVDIARAMREEELDFSMSEEALSIVGMQVLAGVLGRSEQKVYELFADLSGVEPKDIEEMDDDAFWDMVADFLTAGPIKRAVKLFNKLKQ